MSSVTVEVLDLSFSFSDVPLLEGASFSLVPGWTGLVGPNGAGKTTLLDLLEGRRSPDGGQVRVRPKGARVVRCPDRDAGSEERLATFLAAEDGLAAQWRARLGVEHLAPGHSEQSRGAPASPIGPERVRTLSPGERMRLELARALWLEPDVLLLDEPSNHLDGEAREVLTLACRAFDGVGLLVSHDRALLDAVTTRTLRLESGEVRQWALPWSEAREAWLAEERAAADAYELQRGRLERSVAQADAARRSHAAAARATKAGNRMKSPKDRDEASLLADFRAARAEKSQAQALRRAKGKLEGARAELDSLEVVRRAEVDFHFEFEPCPRPLVLAARLAVLAPEGGPVLARDVALDVGRADRVALEGANGAGKTTLLAALQEECTLPVERVLVLPQTLSEEDRDEDQRTLRELSRVERGRVLQVVDALGVDPDRLLASRSPSAGEARKLRLALGLGRAAWVLLLDEPTNDLDLPSVERLEAVLAAWPGAAVVVSHDPRFLERTCTRRVRIEGGRLNEVR